MLPPEVLLELTMCVVAGAHQQQPAVHQLLSRPSTDGLLLLQVHSLELQLQHQQVPPGPLHDEPDRYAHAAAVSCASDVAGCVVPVVMTAAAAGGGVL